MPARVPIRLSDSRRTTAGSAVEDDVDVAGNPRLRKGTVDMGCYEPLFPGLLLLVK